MSSSGFDLWKYTTSGFADFFVPAISQNYNHLILHYHQMFHFKKTFQPFYMAIMKKFEKGKQQVDMIFKDNFSTWYFLLPQKVQRIFNFESKILQNWRFHFRGFFAWVGTFLSCVCCFSVCFSRGRKGPEGYFAIIERKDKDFLLFRKFGR